MKFAIVSLLLLLSFTIKGQQNNEYGFEGPPYFDTYHEYWNVPEKWTIYNVHDPSVNKDGEWYYMYSTDVSMGGGTPYGGHKRRSGNLIDWEFLGTAFDGITDSAREYFLTYNPDYEDGGIWAPYLHKAENEFRLYYSAPGGLVHQNLGYIGYATSESAEGPWEDKGMVASSHPGDTINAIDPTIVVDVETGQNWMAYGSYQMGIYMVELNPETGGLLEDGDRGHLIARRHGGRHASIEGPEIIYRNGWYYLFVSYDWLEDYYNVRVGRSRNPEGPYYDFDGNDMAVFADNIPMILFPYRFNHHVGWQGTGHCGVFRDGDQYYMVHQGRTSSSIYNMVLHVRKMFWIDGWPVLSPQRYAGVPQTGIDAEMIPGQWEHIPMVYDRTVTNLRPDLINLDSDGRINGSNQNTWSLDADTLIMSWHGGQYIDRMIVSHAWDWENRCLALVYTGMNQNGLNIWGKRVNQEVVEKNTVLEHGSAYIIRNHHSNKVLDAQSDSEGANVRQWEDTGEENQEWVLMETAFGYFMLSPLNSNDGKVLEVSGDSPSNGANIRIGSNRFADSQKWLISYLDNGYFSIKSTISGEQRGVDVANFGIHNGANIMQWDYLSGINQFWRFERTRTNVETGFGVGIARNSADTQGGLVLNLFPNPVAGGNNFSVSIKGNQRYSGSKQLIIRNLSGTDIYSATFDNAGTYTIRMSMAPGVYTVSVYSGNMVANEKLVVF